MPLAAIAALLLLAATAGSPQPAANPADGCIPADVPQQSGYLAAPDGTRLFYRKLGRGRPVAVYLHGGPGGTIYNGGCELAPLARRHALILYDQRGGGRSDLISDPARLTLRHHVEDLEAVRRHLGNNRMALIGFSWGAVLAASYADLYPRRVTRLLLLAPMPVAKVPFDKERNERTAAVAGPELMQRRSDLQKQLREAKSDREVIELCNRVQRETPLPYSVDPAALRPLTGCDYPAAVIRNRNMVLRATLQSLGEWDLRPQLARVKQPVLVVEGAQTSVPLSSTRLWAAIPANGRLVLVNKAGHDVTLDKPDAVLKLADRFLGGTWPAEATRPSR